MRDGLQNHPAIIATADKKAFFDKLLAAGLTDFEVTSFVNPAKVPQMADAEQFYPQIADLEKKGKRLTALVPNETQLERAIHCGVKTIALFTSPSNTFNKKNINRDVEGSLKDIRAVAKKARNHGMEIKGSVSMVFGCPHEGEIDEALLLQIIEHYLSLDVYEISLCDTIGIAGPRQVHERVDRIKENFGLDKIALHLHDTRGMAVANVLAALDCGVAIFDSAAGGLGGCPFARGAKGNVATESLVYLFTTLGIKCGVDPARLEAAIAFFKPRLRVSNKKQSGEKPGQRFPE